MLEGHGDDVHAYPNIRFNFSSNVYYKGCNEKLVDVLQKEMRSKLNNYPSPTAEELNKKAAFFHNMEEEQILFFNGATEAFYTIAHHFKGATACVFGPTFSEYEDACRAHDIQINWRARTTFEEATVTDKLAFVCNPNNPDGTVVSQETILQFLRKNSETYLVVDEAYIDFTLSTNSVIEQANHFERLIIVRSLTKVFGIPGLRLGYVVASKQTIQQLKQKKMPWSVNGLAIAGGTYIFDNYTQLHFSKEALLEEMDRFKEQLSAITFLQLLPTETTYVLAELKKGTAYDLKNFLALEHDILIRDATNFVGIEGQYIRLSLQNNKANEALLTALKSW